MESQKLKFNVGCQMKIYYHKNHPMNRLLHIRAIVDNDFVVCRFWDKKGQNWRYTIENKYHYEYIHNHGNLKMV